MLAFEPLERGGLPRPEQRRRCLFGQSEHVLGVTARGRFALARLLQPFQGVAAHGFEHAETCLAVVADFAPQQAVPYQRAHGVVATRARHNIGRDAPDKYG